MSNRWVGFLIAVVLGILAGLYYGWVLNPVKYIDTTPDSLKADYKTDYVLMAAEVYRSEGDLEQAARRLSLLGDIAPVEIARDAVLYAIRGGYADSDLALLRDLERDLQTWQPEIAPELP